MFIGGGYSSGGKVSAHLPETTGPKGLVSEPGVLKLVSWAWRGLPDPSCLQTRGLTPTSFPGTASDSKLPR